MDEIDGRFLREAIEHIADETPTLRDRLAMAALTTINNDDYSSWDSQAMAAYRLADAMLRARQKTLSSSVPPVDASVPLVSEIDGAAH